MAEFLVMPGRQPDECLMGDAPAQSGLRTRTLARNPVRFSIK
jgi:hypothetical protein